MKPNKFYLISLLLMLSLFSQAQSTFFSKYSDMHNVSSVYISKTMIEMNPELYTKDLYIGKIAGQLDQVQILSTMDNNLKKEMRRDFENIILKYELLMKQKGIVSRTAFYVLRKGDRIKDLIMSIDGPAALNYIRLTGDMTLKDIQNIMKSQDTSINYPISQELNAILYRTQLQLQKVQLEKLGKDLEQQKENLKNIDWSDTTEEQTTLL